MGQQLKAGVRKEWLELLKTGRLAGILGIILGLAILDPVMIRGIAWIMELLEKSPSLSMLESLSGAFVQDTALASFAADCGSTALLVVFLLLMRTAGGEQKRRSIVIPITLGMDRESYIFAKFLVYPVVVFVGTLLGYSLAYGLSALLFTSNLTVGAVLPAAVALALYMTMHTCLLLGIGCATGKAGIAVVILYLLHTILTTALGALDWNHYNPLAMFRFAGIFENIDWADYCISIGITIAVCFASAVVSALLFQRKKLL